VKINSLVMILTIKIGLVVLDIHLFWRTKRLEIVHTSAQ